MVSAATTAATPGQNTAAPPAGGNKNAPPPPPPAPFTAGAHEHVEGPFFDVSTQMDASLHAIGPFNIPAYGYLKSVLLLVNATGGADSGETVAANADAPWNVLQNVQLRDVNSAPLVGPFPSGYNLYLANKYGGYAWAANPVLSPFYSGVAVGSNASGNFQFLIRVPVEITPRDALGALPNQNAASTYKLDISIAPSTTVYTTAPDTKPVIRVRGFLEAWSQPLPNDVRGMPQATVPPALGTTQYWSMYSPPVNSGSQTVQLQRVGNLIRTLVFVARDSNGVRSASVFPDPVQLLWDTRILYQEAVAIRQQYVQDRYDYGLGESAQDTGVYVYDYTHDLAGHVGDELRDLYLPTTQATRLEIQGSFGAAGTLDILTNDVAPTADIRVS